MDKDEKLVELERMQAELSEMAGALSKETNGDKLMEKAKEVQAKAAELEVLAAAYQAEADLKAHVPETGTVVIELTEEQQRNIRAETGIEMTELVLEEQPHWMNKAMPRMSPVRIEAKAMEIAKAEADARVRMAQTRAELLSTFAALEEQAKTNKELRPHIRKMKDDPAIKEILNSG